MDIQREKDISIEDVLLELQLVDQKDIMHANAKKMGIPFVDLSEYQIEDESVPLLITRNIANRYKVIPIEKDNGVLTVAMDDPADIFCIDDIRLATAMEIKPVLSDVKEIEKLIAKYFEEEKKHIKPPEQIAGGFGQEDLLGDLGSPLSGDDTYGAVKSDVSPNGFESDQSDMLLRDLSMDHPGEGGIFKDKIGNLLVKGGVITQEQLEHALGLQSQEGGLIGRILVSQGYLDRRSLFEFLRKQMGVEFVEVEKININEELLHLVSSSIARMHNLIPIEKSNGTLRVAMSDPMNIFSIDDLRLTTGLEIIPCLGDEEQISLLLERHYGRLTKEKAETTASRLC